MLLKIDGVEIAHYPKDFKCSIKDLDYNANSSFGRAINGDLNRNRIAVKRTLTLTFNALEWSKLSAVLQQMSATFFEMYYPDTMTGSYETKTFYVSDRPAQSVNSQLSVDGKIYWNGFTYNLIEK